MLPLILNSPLCGSLMWGDLCYCYSKARLFIQVIFSSWDWVWVFSPVYKMLSHSVFLGARESHLLGLLSTFGFEKLLLWMKGLCLNRLISFTKGVSQARAGKELIFLVLLLFTFVYLPVKGTGKDITNYLYHPQSLAGIFYKTWQMVLVSCFNAFLLVTFVFFPYTNLILGVAMLLCVISKVDLKPGLIGRREEKW